MTKNFKNALSMIGILALVLGMILNANAMGGFFGDPCKDIDPKDAIGWCSERHKYVPDYEHNEGDFSDGGTNFGGGSVGGPSGPDGNDGGRDGGGWGNNGIGNGDNDGTNPGTGNANTSDNS